MCERREHPPLPLLRPHVAEIYAGALRRRRGVLTPREWEVLELAAGGLSNAQIAARLFTSVSTVRKHMEHIFDRTGMRSRGAAVVSSCVRLAGPPHRRRPSPGSERPDTSGP